jgi:hypothetical protein
MTSTKELATAIAARLPGEWTVTMPHDQANHYFRLTRADGLELGLFGQGEKGYIRTGSDPTRLEVSMNVPQRHGSYANLSGWGIGSYSEPVATPKANMAASKPIDALAKDIVRRVVEPAAPLHETIRAKMAADKAAADDLDAQAAALRKAFPAMTVETKDGSSSVSIYLNKSSEGLYITGRVSGGSVSLDRVGSFPADRLEAVINAIMGR